MCCCFDTSNTMNISDFIDLLGIVVNSGLAIWVVSTLQNNLTNKRYLKDHLIKEICEIRGDYKKFLTELYNGRIKPKAVVPWFKLMNIKTRDIMEILSQKFEIDSDFLKPYQSDLRTTVTELNEFIANYSLDTPLTLEENSKRNDILISKMYSSLSSFLGCKVGSFKRDLWCKKNFPRGFTKNDFPFF